MKISPFVVFARRNVLTTLVAFLAGVSSLSAQTGTALVRHAPVINGSVDGSVQMLLGENVTLSGVASLTGDLLVPGTPTVQVNGSAHSGGTIDGTGSAVPSAYAVTLNDNSSVHTIVRRTDAIALPVVNPSAAPTGTRTVMLSAPGQSPGDFATVRTLLLSSGFGPLAVPPGTYGDFIVNTRGTLVLGVAGSTVPTVYNFQTLTLNSSAVLQVVGPVIVTLNIKIAMSAGATLGSVDHPSWLRLRFVGGDFPLPTNATAYAMVEAPAGTISLATGSRLIGGASSDRLAINGTGRLSLVGNLPPQVTLLTPTDGAVFTAPAANLTLSADATDSDGAVTKVDFYQGTTLLGTSASAPFQFEWANVPAGTYQLTAIATDNQGATSVSAIATVVLNAPPTVTLTSPADGTIVAAPGSLNLAADAADSDGSVAKVDFYQSGVLVHTSTTAPYTFAVSGLASGVYTFSAVATDDRGASTTSAEIFATVDEPPTVSLSTPANGATFTAPASIALAATAGDTDGTVARVDFYRGATLLGSASAAPFQFNWTNVPNGNYTLTAVAVDDLGLSTTSAPISITVTDPAPATVTFDSASSASIATATTTLSWSHTLNAGPGSSRAVVVGVVSRGSSVANASASGATFNGVPMISLATSVANAGSGTFNRSQLFYLLDASLPAAGTYTVQVTFAVSQSASNNPLGGAISLTNVSQSAPAGFSNSSGTGTANTLTTVVSASPGSWVVDTFGVGSTTANIVTNATGMVSRFNVPQVSGVPNSGAAGSTLVAGTGGSATMSWRSATAREVHSLAVFAPALSVPTAPSITTPPVSQTVDAGANVSFTVAAGGSAPLSYQWFKNSSPIPGATSLTLNLGSVQTDAAGNYTVLVSNSAGSVTSDPATLVVNVHAPTITTQPTSQNVNLGDNASFTVAATGTAPLSYQWYKNGLPIPGATSTSLAFNPTQASDDASYQVIVTNPVSSTPSDIVALSVNTGPVAPHITTHPLSQTVGVGANVTFTVLATGTAPLSYQWQKDGVDLPSENSAALNLSSVQFGDAGTYRVIVSNAVDTVTSHDATLTVNALTSPSAIYNLTGFATAGAGTTGGGVILETDPAYKKVSTPLDFANAVALANKTAGAVKVIEIMNDLALGWNEVGTTVQTLPSNPFRSHNAPLLHPVLLVTGVSVIDIKPKSGLTIFSANGSTIRHATLNIKSASNIIVRNLKFDEMWEWDEATKGDYDKNDWDFITLGNGGATTNVWIDHCTFTKGYDGVTDMKAGTQFVTMSWCKYVGDDGATNPNSFVRQQIAALEANPAAHPFYNFLRTRGFSTEDIITIQQGHDKTHLMGSNSLDSNNATLSATFHHQWMNNLWDRCVPRLRAGNVHNYNLYVDDTGVLAAKRLRDLRAAAMSTADRNTLNNTYSFNPPINGSISTEGGAILLEKSVYIDCLTPLRNNQTDPTNPVYTGKILGLDTIYHMDNANGTTTDVRGNSTDPGNPLGPLQAPVIPFSWNLPGNVLPYSYTADDPAALLPILQTGAGAGTITWSKENWLKTSY
jgi:pectate lyase